MTDNNDLEGKVALVAGATRGAGRAISVELGARGATVYCSGRTSRHASTTTSHMNRPGETIEETAELVSQAGGRGIPAVTDHTDPVQVQQLTRRIDVEQDGRLDILVNDIWGGDPLIDWDAPFWQHDITRALEALRLGVHTHLVTARFAVPLMVERKDGLVIEVTDGDKDGYRGQLYYDLAKASVIRIARGMAHDLAPHGITALAVTPGFLRSEAMLDHFGVTADTWRDAIAKDEHFAFSETPHLLGRCVAALAADPDVARHNGRSLASWTLAHEYGIDDVDGTRPDWGAHAATFS